MTQSSSGLRFLFSAFEDSDPRSVKSEKARTVGLHSVNKELKIQATEDCYPLDNHGADNIIIPC